VNIADPGSERVVGYRGRPLIPPARHCAVGRVRRDGADANRANRGATTSRIGAHEESSILWLDHYHCGMSLPHIERPDLPEFMTWEELERLPEEIAEQIELWNGRVV
jgi:hypothetical protein